MSHKFRILVIDDEKDMLNACCKILDALGYHSILADNGKLAIELLAQDEFDLILCDLFLPEVDGMDVLKKSNELAPQTPVIIFTAYGTVDRAVAAMKFGAFDFIEKPFEIEHLKVLIKKGLSQRKLYLERLNLLSQLLEKYSFDNIIGQSSAMNKIFDLVESVAPTDVNILITGDSGTGKELIARSIHSRSSRHTHAFVPVNCSAFPETLFEAELFGYEKGAFTGATRRKLGLLEFADEGTFFLDEVCELPPSLQAKLLRVLQDQQLRHVGGTELIQVDVRLISATNWDLERARTKGLLRDDFYYRINVVNIHIPPLRDRREDIPLLAEYFLRNQLKTSARDINGFHPLVLIEFENYNWPGNVRELENVIEHAVAVSRGNEITLADLPTNTIQKESKFLTTNQMNDLSLAEMKNRSYDEIERTYLIRHLKEFKGNVTQIAQKAQMTRRNLHRLLKKHGLDPSSWRIKCEN
ncbi:MAG: sigma-54-dependent Fis family transcriptional regulator [Candidatus Omnitrophota bacterium]|nr:MAG: sigma-54-dependent Fis family transcriptional regulator [Candidatus Omnitrophota bacterium]